MSSLRRRTSNGGIQWLIIGLILGLGCASVVCVAGYAFGAIRLGGSAVAFGPTPTVGPSNTPVVMTVIITATPAPTNTPAPISDTPQPITPIVVTQTDTPFVIVSSPQGTPGAAQPLPTLPPLPASTSGTSGGNGASNTSVTPTGAAGLSVGVTLPPPGAELPPGLTQTDLVTIIGTTFTMGTTANEARAAVDDCTTRDKGQCQITDAQDSIPEHQVTVNTFQIEKYEVSYDQYLAFLNSLTDSYRSGCDGQACIATTNDDKNSPIKLDGTTFKLSNGLFQNYAVTFVTWYGADAYCKAIGRRLPTEAEWERTARSAGGNQTDKRLYPWGNAWDGNNANTSRPTPSKGFTQPIDSYSLGVSADGVYNLAGNAGEWVNDWYDPNYYKSTDQSHLLNPKGPPSGAQKVVRGGAWDEVPFFSRTVQRRSESPSQTFPDVGFRCAADTSANGGSAGGAPGQPTTSGSSASALTPNTLPTLKP